MSIRRERGEWVALSAGAGMVGEADRLRAQIQPDPQWSTYTTCCFWCEDPDCREWDNVLTEPDPQADGQRWPLSHVNECQMHDCQAP